ncbi:P-loop containing nucleoside triphosphate hydrolase protein [Coniochaeta ligniaria NRRL 30616]|uniref:RNA helicase n=1 Tax=Coniochaeta ligniaria NRRL 30616 TaxID=1408157 RepID=A0A1J7J6B6_9PEZI|nr:P-loop containing nucleoside triphosphate hydrolase protein [Coniochaeta ligniaria NRRL 30616]
MSKKRKSPGSHESLKVGNKIISLEGYLSKKRKTEPDSTPTPNNQVEAASKANTPAKEVVESSDPSRKLLRKNRREVTGAKPRASAGDPAYLETRKELPLWGYQDRIRGILRKRDVLVLVGETGSGKSTQVPQFLYQEDWCRPRRVKAKGEEVSVGGIIAITQPRRVAATTLAHRVSREVGTPISATNGSGDSGGASQESYVKGLVGYSVRFDHNIPRGTKIKFLTEGMLLQELLRDPNLRQYSAVIVDEIHERSVDVDLLSGFLKQIHCGDKAGRGGIPLKLVIMSATANVEGIQEFFSASDEAMSLTTNIESSQVECLRIEGRQYPVEVTHTPKAVPDLQEALLKTVFKIHLQEPLPGDILAFLTGQEEIESTQKLIEEYAATLPSNAPKVKVLPLFGQLSIEAQHEAFRPLKAKFTRKIVLATNIAETSVTVPGVKFVIDCGKAKVKEFRARLGMESLLAKAISKSSATQRAGRAGREAAGKCFRLYTEDTFNGLADRDLPEILRNDVLGAVLTMKARGIDDVLSFPLMDSPSVESIEKALVHLHLLKAIDDNGTITETGRKMARFPISAPLGRVLLAAASPQYDCVLEVIDIISCITAGDDIFHQLQSEEAREEVDEFRKELYRREGDLLTYLTTIQHYAAEDSDRVDWCKKRKINIRNMRQAMNIRKQLRGLCLREKLLAEPPPPDPQPFMPVSPKRAETLVKCFLMGYTLKTAMLAPDSSYVTTHGKHVVAIHPSSVLHGQKREAIMFLEHVFTQKNYAKKVSIIQAQWIADALEED